MVRSFLVLMLLLLPWPAGATQPTPAVASEVTVAIESGRLDQARLMVSKLIEAGAPAESVDRALADLAFASGRDEEAVVRYQALLEQHPSDAVLSERAGVAALRLGRLADAKEMLDRSIREGSSSWRSLNARGVLADLEQDWATARASYDSALALKPAEARILNNIGYSHLLQGAWSEAIDYFERAHAMDPSVERIGNNLELARSALDSGLPQRRPRESASDWAARLNDAGVAAQALGDRRRAIASFTRALEAKGNWYARAANNLEALNAK